MWVFIPYRRIDSFMHFAQQGLVLDSSQSKQTLNPISFRFAVTGKGPTCH